MQAAVLATGVLLIRGTCSSSVNCLSGFTAPVAPQQTLGGDPHRDVERLSQQSHGVPSRKETEKKSAEPHIAQKCEATWQGAGWEVRLAPSRSPARLEHRSWHPGSTSFPTTLTCFLFSTRSPA